jgi:hypothetical protein
LICALAPEGALGQRNDFFRNLFHLPQAAQNQCGFAPPGDCQPAKKTFSANYSPDLMAL